MRTFRLLTKTRQATEYSCGASALQAVLSYWGMEVEEEALMKLLHTTPEEGTYPEDIVRGAQSLGFTAELKHSLTLEEVEQFTAEGDPMIALAQLWRSETNSPAAVTEDWDDGHYVVVLGVDDDYVHFQDPYARMSKGFMPRASFVEHWHQVMGGDLRKNPKLMQVGIFIRGKERAAHKAATDEHLASLDFERFGSLNLIGILFQRKILPYDFVSALRSAWSDAHVRADAFLFLHKDADGRLFGLEGGGILEDSDAEIVNAVLAALASRGLTDPQERRIEADAVVRAAAEGDFGLTATALQQVAKQIAPGQSAIVALFENVWERKFKEITRQYGGAVVTQKLVSPSELAKAASGLSATAKRP